MIELLLLCGFDTLEYSWVKGYNWHLYAYRLFFGYETPTPILCNMLGQYCASGLRGVTAHVALFSFPISD
jgi:hypothetical protein